MPKRDTKYLKQQTVAVTEAKPNEGPVYRRSDFKDQLVSKFEDNITTLYEVINDLAKQNPKKNCFGTREIGADGKAGKYVWQTFEQVIQSRDKLAAGLRALGLKEGENIGIYSQNSPEWMITDFAATACKCPSISLYDTLGPDAVEYIINHGNIGYAVCSPKTLKHLTSASAKCECLKVIICAGNVTDEQRKEVENTNAKLYTFAEIEKKGEETPSENLVCKPEDVYTIMYTSGTTGNPKGVILTHAALVAEITGVRKHETEDFLGSSEVHMSYLPLAHSFERAVIYTVLSYVGSVGFSQGIITELVNDIGELKPTFLVGAPRVWTRIHDRIMSTVDAGSGFKKWMFHKAYSSKQKNLKQGKESGGIWDSVVFKKTKERLGGRVRFLLSGSAPLDPKLAEFLRIAFCCKVLEGYGLTETCAGAFITHVDDLGLGHVGVPLCSVEAKLVDVSEMEYNAQGNPPKGEIVIRGHSMFKGYYKEEDKTKEVLEEDGWFHTGDIGRWNENGTLSIIDRKKNIFKLAQGEYVAVEYLEGIFIRGKFVQQVWVYGNSLKSKLLAVVVPDFDYLKGWAAKNNISGSEAELCANEKVNKAVLDEMEKVGKDAQLRGFEVVKGLILEHEVFSVDNDLMTPSFKLRRPQLQKKYQEKLDAMYASIDP